MRCLDFEVQSRTTSASGVPKVNVVASLMSSDVPLTFPSTGDGIEGLDANYNILPGSTVYVVNNATVYMANEDMTWKKQ